MGFLPRDPLFRDDTKGGARPPLDTPASPPLVLRNGRLRGEPGNSPFGAILPLIDSPSVSPGGRIQRGGPEPPSLSRRGGGVRRGGTPSKGSLPVRPFAYFSGEGKVGRGVGVDPPQSHVQRRGLCKTPGPWGWNPHQLRGMAPLAHTERQENYSYVTNPSLPLTFPPNGDKLQNAKPKRARPYVLPGTDTGPASHGMCSG